jgi:RNA polymerase sigma-70 factor (ECF subfamily)
MGSVTPQSITALLRAWSNGDQAALDQLVPLVDAELHRIAKRCLERESQHGSLQTSSLVNEAYLRLIDIERANWQDRAHFFAVSARIMRRLLVDRARARRAVRHGGGLQRLPLEEALVFTSEPTSDIVAIDEALNALAELSPRKGRVVELRFFGGLTVEETAHVLGISSDSVKRDWRLAKLWLLRQLTGEHPHVPPTMATD